MGNQTNVRDHLTTEHLEAGLEHIRQSPADGGSLLMIVRRPGTDEREVVEEAALDVDVGLVGDNWKARGSPRTPDGKANPEAQITMMNSRLLALLAQSRGEVAASGRSARDRHGSERRQPAARDAAVNRIGGGGDIGKAAYGVREVRRPLRQGSAEVHKHPFGEEPAAPGR